MSVCGGGGEGVCMYVCVCVFDCPFLKMLDLSLLNLLIEST